MEILRVDPHRPEPGVVEAAAARLRRGDVVAGPSDTVYGFLGRADDSRARGELARLKTRPGPFLVLVADWSAARRLAGDVEPALWSRLARVWPGPVTVILPAAADVEFAHENTVALRMPQTTLLIRLLAATGGPLLSTSANRAGEPAPVTADEVARSFGGEIGLLLDGGPAESAEPSTLVACTGPRARVLRRGRGDARPLLDPDGRDA